MCTCVMSQDAVCLDHRDRLHGCIEYGMDGVEKGAGRTPQQKHSEHGNQYCLRKKCDRVQCGATVL